MEFFPRNPLVSQPPDLQESALTATLLCWEFRPLPYVRCKVYIPESQSASCPRYSTVQHVACHHAKVHAQPAVLTFDHGYAM